MKIVDIREKTVPLAAPTRNADIRFDEMTASAVAVFADLPGARRPLVGLAFDSIGRYGHGGLMRERFIPRLLAADPEVYCEPGAGLIDPARAFAVMMANEKGGGHGERAGAVGLLDCALWDLRAKAEDLPLWQVLNRLHGDGRDPQAVPVYASGGHYSEDGLDGLRSELAEYRDAGFSRFKIKIGGASLKEDLRRVETALSVARDGAGLAVDANGIWELPTAKRYLKALAAFDLAWIEEPAPPLDFFGLATLAHDHEGSLATGENLFSAEETDLLLRIGGLRPDRDWLQMDVSLSYGVTGYLHILETMARHGWDRRRAAPHAGHLLALHVAVGLGLGGHEAAPNPALPIGGFAEDAEFADGRARPGDSPGAGLERKPALYEIFKDLTG